MRGAALFVLAVLTAAQPPATLATLAIDGWAAARSAAAEGGSAQSLARARSLLTRLDALVTGTPWRLQGEYAHALIAAAMAASQNENAEMDLHLTHARALSDRLQTSAYPALWPVGIDEAEGELWLEVDRYADALAAFRRAVGQPNAQSTAWLGLARSAARMNDQAAACDAYRRWAAGAANASGPPEMAEATEYLKRCP
jgi:hypothetical protein